MLTNLSFETMLQNVLAFLPQLAMALIIFILSYLLSRGVARTVRRTLERRERDPELIVLLVLIARWGVFGFGIVLSIEQLAPGQLSSLVAGLGVAGFTIGFALQDVAKNFIAGVILLLQQPFDIGDGVEINGYAGKVLDINLRATEMMTWDGRHVIIPNSEIYASPIINFSRATRRRLEIKAGVAYESDLDDVARIALETINKVEGVLDDPSATITFSSLGDFAVTFTLHYWIDTDKTGYFVAVDEGIRFIKSAFEEAAIDMPFPTQSIHLQSPPPFA